MTFLDLYIMRDWSISVEGEDVRTEEGGGMKTFSAGNTGMILPSPALSLPAQSVITNVLNRGGTIPEESRYKFLLWGNRATSSTNSSCLPQTPPDADICPA